MKFLFETLKNIVKEWKERISGKDIDDHFDNPYLII